MSTVVTENLKRAAEAVARSVRGLAMAWLNMNGTGTVTIRNSLNTSSIADTGTGDYAQNLTAAATAATYGFTGMLEPGGGTGDKGPYYRGGTVSVFSFASLSGTGAFVDNSIIGLELNGDLA